MKKAIETFLLISLMVFIMAGNSLSQDEPTQTDIKNIIQEVYTQLKENYIYPDIATKVCDAIHKSLKDGRYNKVKDWETFTNVLNEDFRRVTDDQHLEASVHKRTFKKERTIKDLVSSSFNSMSYRKKNNFMMPKVEVLEGNIGYIEFTSFKPLPDPETERIVSSAMDFLSNCDALIIDLRRNGGGHTNMREFISSYFFDTPKQLSSTYIRDTGSFYESFTIKDFYNKKLVEVPLYILTSSRTISAPEIFAYDLQTLERAIVVGETTAGSVNSGRFFTIGNSIDLLIATGFTKNPITDSNCEGKGITPDVEATSEEALDVAMSLAKNSAAECRKNKEIKLNEHIDEFLMRLEKVEKRIENDRIVAEKALKQLIKHFYDIEFMTPYLLLDLGDWYLKEGRANMAVIILKQGPGYYSGLMEMYIFYKLLAKAYMEMDDKYNAIKCYLEYLRLFPYDSNTMNKLNDIIENRQAN